MANPQIRSVSSTITDTDAASLVCTHPSGLTAGDFMLLFVEMYNGGSDQSILNISGWTNVASASVTNRRRLRCFSKTATAGDVSAGSTTVTFSDICDKFAFGMLAITGQASGQEITVTVETDTFTASGTSISPTTASTPAVSESLVVSCFATYELALTATLTASSFSLTPTTTMTERVDVGNRDGLSDGISLFIATGEYDGTTEITGRSVTVSESITGQGNSIFLLVNAPQNATGTNSLLSVSPTLFAPTVSAGTTGTNALLDVSPTHFNQSGTATAPTQWSNEAKPSTTWTNET